MRFKDFNLEVVTVDCGVCDYSMTINKKFVTFSKSIVQDLEYPPQVLIAFNKKTKVMGIQVCRAKSRGAFKFAKPEGRRRGAVQVQNKNLKETLFHIMDEWEEGKRYKVEGIHIPEDKAFIFELKEYQELPDFRNNRE